MCKPPIRMLAAMPKDQFVTDIETVTYRSTDMRNSKNPTPYFQGTNAEHVATYEPTEDRPAHSGTYSLITDAEGNAHTFWFPKVRAELTTEGDDRKAKLTRGVTDSPSLADIAKYGDPRIRQANEDARKFWRERV